MLGYETTAFSIDTLRRAELVPVRVQVQVPVRVRVQVRVQVQVRVRVPVRVRVQVLHRPLSDYQRKLQEQPAIILSFSNFLLSFR